eukprot:4285044-Lingulodinium_polyedra.AAC.1
MLTWTTLATRRRPTLPGRSSSGWRGAACAPSRFSDARVGVRVATGVWTSWPHQRRMQRSGASNDVGAR